MMVRLVMERMADGTAVCYLIDPEYTKIRIPWEEAASSDWCSTKDRLVYMSDRWNSAVLEMPICQHRPVLLWMLKYKPFSLFLPEIASGLVL
jgi:hypothetical protein